MSDPTQPLEVLLARIDTPGRRGERSDAVLSLVEACRVEPALRERFLLRFVTLLADDEATVRGEAIPGVLLCDEPLTHLPRLLRLFQDPKPGVRLQAVLLLGPMEQPEVLEALRPVVDDADVQVRGAAATMVLAREPGNAAARATLAGLCDERAVRYEALLALARAGAPEAKTPAVRLYASWFVTRHDRLAAAFALARCGEAAGLEYVRKRAEKRGLDRPAALELLGELGAPEGLPLLAAIARDPTVPHRGAALRAWAGTGAPEGVQLCERLVGEGGGDVDLRCDAIEGLLLAGAGRAALEALIARGDDAAPIARTALTLLDRPAHERRHYLPLEES